MGQAEHVEHVARVERVERVERVILKRFRRVVPVRDRQEADLFSVHSRVRIMNDRDEIVFIKLALQLFTALELAS